MIVAIHKTHTTCLLEIIIMDSYIRELPEYLPKNYIPARKWTAEKGRQGHLFSQNEWLVALLSQSIGTDIDWSEKNLKLLLLSSCLCLQCSECILHVDELQRKHEAQKQQRGSF